MTIIYNAAEFREAYGPHFKASPGSLPFLDEDVPPTVAPLIPYARFWGVTDHGDQEDLLDTVPEALQRNFREAVYSLDDAIEEWLLGDGEENSAQAGDDEMTNAAVAFSAMVMAADSVRFRG